MPSDGTGNTTHPATSIFGSARAVDSVDKEKLLFIRNESYNFMDVPIFRIFLVRKRALENADRLWQDRGNAIGLQ